MKKNTLVTLVIIASSLTASLTYAQNNSPELGISRGCDPIIAKFGDKASKLKLTFFGDPVLFKEHRDELVNASIMLEILDEPNPNGINDTTLLLGHSTFKSLRMTSFKHESQDYIIDVNFSEGYDEKTSVRISELNELGKLETVYDGETNCRHYGWQFESVGTHNR